MASAITVTFESTGLQGRSWHVCHVRHVAWASDVSAACCCYNIHSRESLLYMNEALLILVFFFLVFDKDGIDDDRQCVEQRDCCRSYNVDEWPHADEQHK